jgi:hypothetical protein
MTDAARKNVRLLKLNVKKRHKGAVLQNGKLLNVKLSEGDRTKYP